jgi:hypothetical protein
MSRGRPPGPDPKKVFRIVKTLTETGDWVWIRELSRKSKLPLTTVHYYLEKHLNRFIDEINTAQFISYEEGGKYPRIRLVKIKDGISFEKIMKWLRFKEKI